METILYKVSHFLRVFRTPSDDINDTFIVHIVAVVHVPLIEIEDKVTDTILCYNMSLNKT